MRLYTASMQPICTTRDFETRSSMIPLTAAPAQLNITAEGKISADTREIRGAMVVGAPARAGHLLREPDQPRAPKKAHHSSARCNGRCAT